MRSPFRFNHYNLIWEAACTKLLTSDNTCYVVPRVIQGGVISEKGKNRTLRLGHIALSCLET
jgi:hypothetical protein